MAKNDKRNLHIIALSLQGCNIIEIGKKTNLTHQRISQILHDKDYKHLIEEGHKRQVIGLHRAVNKHEELISSEDEKVALAAVQLRYKTVGILPTQHQSIYINSLFVTNATILDPNTLSLLDRALGLPATTTEVDSDVIDADITEISQDVGDE